MSAKGFLLRTSFWISDYFQKSAVRKHYSDITAILENTNNYGLKRRDQHLDRLLEHAVRHTRFYADYNSSDFKTFPVINKTIIQNHYDAFKAPPASLPEHPDKIHTHRTSGSTGTPFALLLDDRKQKRRQAELKYFSHRVGFKSHENLLHLKFAGPSKGKTKLQLARENITGFDVSKLDDHKLAALIPVIQKKKISAIRGAASSIDQLAQYVRNNNIHLPTLKVVVAGSEPLFESTRRLVEDYMGCKIISQYANQENGVLGQEALEDYDGKKQLYLNHASYIFEVLQLDSDAPAPYGQLGRIVITDLFNYAQPIIRYDTGDTGIMLENDPLSNGFPVLSHLYGRRNDLIYDIHNTPVNPIEVVIHLKYYDAIIQYQLIQIGQSEYVLKLKVVNAFQPDALVAHLKTLLGGPSAQIQVHYVDDITVLASGKRKSVSNEWQR
jgi:phenylacetate-CoA ligase